MNPRAAINDLLPFQGSPFSLLGTSPNQANQNHAPPYSANRFKVQTFLHLTVRLIKLFSRQIYVRRRRYLQRRGWDSNPCALSDKRFSRPPRYDHFDTSPCRALFALAQRKNYSSKTISKCQHFFSKFFIFFCRLHFLSD